MHTELRPPVAPGAGPAESRRAFFGTLSFAHWMALSHFLVGLPLLALALWVTHQLLSEREVSQQQALYLRTQVTATAIARELDSAQVQLTSLLLSTPAAQYALGEGKQAATHLGPLRRLAAGIVAADPDLLAIHALEPQGPPLFVATAPSAQAQASTTPRLTTPNPSQQAWAALARGESVLLPLEPQEGSASPQAVHWCLPWLPAAQQTQRAAGQPLRALCASFRRSSFTTLLKEQRWHLNWPAALLDSHCRIAARTINEERLLGLSGTPAMCEYIQGVTVGSLPLRSNLMRARTLDGVETIGAAARVPHTDWWVAAGMPVASVREMTLGPLLRLLLGGALLVVLAGLGAFWVARSLVRQVAATAKHDDSQPLSVRELAHIVYHRRHTQEALHQAQHDALTTLPARALFLQQLEALAQSAQAATLAAQPHQLALLYIDLDGLKRTNDLYGHEAGDHLLMRTGHLLHSQLRPGQIAGRLGGDEFAVAFSGPPPALAAAAQDIAQRLLRGVATLGDGVGCSIGLALADPSQPQEILLARADQAMLRAKRAGKNQVLWAE